MNKDRLAARLLATFLGELEEQLGLMNADLLALEGDPSNAQRLRSVFRSAHTLKGAAHAAGVPALAEACHALETLLAQARDQKIVLRSETLGRLFRAVDALADAARRLRAGEDSAAAAASVHDALAGAPPSPAMTAAPESPAETGRTDGQVKLEARKLDALVAVAGQLQVARGRIASRPAELESLHQYARTWLVEWQRTARRVRLALDRAGDASLSQALRATEENLHRLVRDTVRLAADSSQDARGLAEVADDVADQARRLRMRPFADACEALPRVVRDLAAAAGKEVRLEMAGGEVEADRAVLDGVREAILQLVRNAVDHGIESAAQRERAGKPGAGTVRVVAAVRGSQVVVTVSDDGAGLNVEAIRAELARRRLPVPDDEHQLGRALFQSGFSTRRDVTDISGRGVGLDVVRAAVERIRGTVAVAWTPGRGTTFTLECPATLATLRAVLVTVGTQMLGIPSAHVERLLRVRPDEIRQAEGRDVIATADGAVPIAALARLLPPLPERAVTDVCFVVLVRAGDRRLAVVADELVDERELVLRKLGNGTTPLPLLGGAALLGSGRVALVIDPVALVAAGLGLGAGPAVSVAEGRPAVARRRILVVDDSITTRTLEASIVEAAGYEVLTAVDGSDGWRALQERGADLVLTDVEMPRMDGFALCEAIRASKRFKGLPVVLVTGLETPEHRSRGLEVGADAYLGKSSFDQGGLLTTIRQLIG